MKYALGSVLYYWQKEALEAFYEKKQNIVMLILFI